MCSTAGGCSNSCSFVHWKVQIFTLSLTMNMIIHIIVGIVLLRCGVSMHVNIVLIAVLNYHWLLLVAQRSMLSSLDVDRLFWLIRDIISCQSINVDHHHVRSRYPGSCALHFQNSSVSDSDEERTSKRTCPRTCLVLKLNPAQKFEEYTKNLPPACSQGIPSKLQDVVILSCYIWASSRTLQLPLSKRGKNSGGFWYVYDDTFAIYRYRQSFLYVPVEARTETETCWVDVSHNACRWSPSGVATGFWCCLNVAASFITRLVWAPFSVTAASKGIRNTAFNTKLSILWLYTTINRSVLRLRDMHDNVSTQGWQPSCRDHICEIATAPWAWHWLIERERLLQRAAMYIVVSVCMCWLYSVQTDVEPRAEPVLRDQSFGQRDLGLHLQHVSRYVISRKLTLANSVEQLRQRVRKLLWSD